MTKPLISSLKDFRRTGFLIVLLITIAFIVKLLMDMLAAESWSITGRLGGPSVLGFTCLLLGSCWLSYVFYAVIKEYSAQKSAFVLGAVYLLAGFLSAAFHKLVDPIAISIFLMSGISFAYAFTDTDQIMEFIERLGKPAR